MIEADTPTLWDLRGQIGHAATIAIIVMAFTHAARLVNLDKNLTNEQIGEAANDILESYGHMKVEEIKYLLKRALRTQNVYGRLDYNVLMNWVGQYDAERTEEAIRISEQTELQELNAPDPQSEVMGYDEYVANLRIRAKTDDDAAAILKDIDNPPEQKITLLTNEERAQREHDFKMFKFKYQIQRKQNGADR